MTEALFIDFETYSAVDIKKHGSMRYIQDETTEPVCMAYAFWDGPVELWEQGQTLPDKVLDHVAGGGKVYAHNAAFDVRVWNTCTDFPMIDLDQVVDTMALCMTYSLPGSLDGVGKALGTAIQKSAGTRLIKKCCTPQPIKEGRRIIGYLKPDLSSPRYAKDYEDLKTYCVGDVATMREVVKDLPRKELIPVEHEIWKLTAQMNHEGLPINAEEVTAILDRIELALEEGKKELKRITENAPISGTEKPVIVTSPFQYARIKSYCEQQGFPIQNVQAGYVKDLLDDPEVKLPEAVEKVLRLCQMLGKSSTAKYRKMVDYMVPGKAEEHRVHDSLCYHGAGTGRWAGRGVQPQNFPRAQSKQPDEDIRKFVDNETIDDPIGVSKSLLRSVIKAPEGYQLVVSDYSSIENRVLAWVAQDGETLQGFANGFDQYVDMAASKYGRTYEDLKAGCDAGDSESSAQRQMGKVIVLGCGYGMGWETFQKSAKNFGMFLTEEESKEAVGSYREKYYKVVQCWHGLKKVALKAVISGDKVKYGPIVFGKATVNGTPWLAMRLPSGKSIYYCKPFVEDRHVPGFEHRAKVATVMHMGVNPMNRKWTKVPLIPGRITENAVQGLSREIMGRGMLNIVKNMPEVTLIGTVHDEALGLISEEEALGYHEFMREETDCECRTTLEEFNYQLCDVPFVPGLPIEAKGYISKRYRK